MAERIIILGAGVMQGPAIRIARETGLYSVVLDGDEHAPCAGMGDRFEHIDLKDKEAVEALGRAFIASGDHIGIVTAGTDFSATAAWAAERLGLPGVPYEAALNASDKGRMRSCFARAGIPSPAFTVVSKLPAAAELPGPFPLVVKPVDNMGARGCRRVDGMAELSAAAADAIRYSRTGRAIVEEYMDGPEFSVDAVVDHGEIIICGLADRHIYFPPYFIEMGHTMPTAFGQADQDALLDCFRAAARSLGIAGRDCVGAAKGDVKLTANGPMIGEVAARLSGGYMSGWTYPYASGVEPTRAVIELAMGRTVPCTILAPAKTWTSAERAFISIPGRVREIRGTDAAKSVPGVRDLFMRAAAGSAVSFPVNNVSKCGNVIAAAPTREAAVNAAEEAARRILIRLDAPAAETAAFLATDFPRSPFPPSAFDADADLLAALETVFVTVTDGEPCGSRPRLRPFPALTASALVDWQGRTVEASLAAVRELTGLALPLLPDADGTGGAAILGREFWAALIRGGYQGACYYVDTLYPPRGAK